jgi:hypothetical protein
MVSSGDFTNSRTFFSNDESQLHCFQKTKFSYHIERILTFLILSMLTFSIVSIIVHNIKADKRGGTVMKERNSSFENMNAGLRYKVLLCLFLFV